MCLKSKNTQNFFFLINQNLASQVILSPATHTYFDHPTEPHPEERGFYWATRFTDSYKTFSYAASDIYKNIGVNRMGEQLDPEEVCADDACPELLRPANIRGMIQVFLDVLLTVCRR